MISPEIREGLFQCTVITTISIICCYSDTCNLNYFIILPIEFFCLFSRRLTPEAGISYFRESADDFINQIGIRIAGQTAAQGEVRFGPFLSYYWKVDDTTFISPNVGITGRWNFGVQNPNAIPEPVLESGDVRARLDAGVTGVFLRGATINVKGYCDGLGINDFYNYGGDVGFKLPF